MRRIFLDLEMNTISKEHKEVREICMHEVIEFGAVCLNEMNREVDSFQCYVRPEYNSRIMPHITNITGITTEQVANADTFGKALEEFISWCGTDYEIYSWSDSDPVQIQKEMELKKIKGTPDALYMFAHWNDLQKEYDDMFFCERQIGLNMAVNNAGLEFRGRAHSALGDAVATADLYREMVQGKTLKKLNNMLTSARKPIGTNLGDLLGGFVLQGA